MRYAAAILILILSSCSGLPTNIDSMRKKADDFLIRGDYFSAKNAYEDLLVKDADLAPEHLYNHAFCLWKLEKYDEAIIELNELISKYPDDEYADHALLLILYVRADQRNKNSYIIKELAQYLNQNPDKRASDMIQYSIGLLHFLSKEYHKTRQSFDELKTNYPNSEHIPDAEFLIAQSYFEEKQYDKAKIYFEEYLEKYRDVAPDFASDARTYIRIIEDIIEKGNQ